MTDGNSTTGVHAYKPDGQDATFVTEGGKHSTNTDYSSTPTVTETHDQKEKLVIENPDDSLTTVTHQLDDIHITVANDISTPVTQETDVTTTEEVKDKVNNVMTTGEENLNEAAPVTSENATELKNEPIVAVQDAQEQNPKTEDNIQEQAAEKKANELLQNAEAKAAELKHNAEIAAHNVQEKTKELVHNAEEKATEIAANIKEALITGEKLAEEQLAAAIEIIKEQTNALADSAKQTANDVSVKTQELEKSAEQQLEVAEKTGAQKFEDVKNATVAAVESAAATVAEKTNALLGSNEPTLPATSTATNPAPVVQEVVTTSTTVVSSSSPVVETPTATKDRVSNAATVPVTPGKTARNSGAVTSEPAPSATAAAAAVPKTGGPFNSIRNFFSNLFKSNPRTTQGERQKTSTTATNSTTTLQTAGKPNNPPSS